MLLLDFFSPPFASAPASSALRVFPEAAAALTETSVDLPSPSDATCASAALQSADPSFIAYLRRRRSQSASSVHQHQISVIRKRKNRSFARNLQRRDRRGKNRGITMRNAPSQRLEMKARARPQSRAKRAPSAPSVPRRTTPQRDRCDTVGRMRIVAGVGAIAKMHQPQTTEETKTGAGGE